MPGIVVGVDGSGHSLSGLEWAAKEAAVRHAPLTVLTVQQAMVGYFGAPVTYQADEDLAEGARQAARESAEKVLAQLGDSRPASVTVQAVVGFPAEELLRAAEDADLLVVGSRGAGGFTRLLLGSVSSQVTQHASCPVVVVPARDRG